MDKWRTVQQVTAPTSLPAGQYDLRLKLFFDKNLERALEILDIGGVLKLSAEPSGRAVFKCKHQLAARLSQVLQCCPEVKVSDATLAKFLLGCKHLATDYSISATRQT
eukprot:jgi/Mesen1/5945/ME000301S05080